MIQDNSTESKKKQDLPRPTVVPAIGAWAVGLDASVLNGDTAPDIVLHHGNSVQSSDVLSLCSSLSLFHNVAGRVHET
jgi:hypothetical protein